MLDPAACLRACGRGRLIPRLRPRRLDLATVPIGICCPGLPDGLQGRRIRCRRQALTPASVLDQFTEFFRNLFGVLVFQQNHLVALR